MDEDSIYNTDWSFITSGDTTETAADYYAPVYNINNHPGPSYYYNAILLSPTATSSTPTLASNGDPQPTTGATRNIVLPNDWFLNPSGLTPEDCRYPPLETIDVKIGFARKGRKSLLSKFPIIKPMAQAFVKQHGFEAHKRRKGVGTCGTCVRDVRSHIWSNVSGFRGSQTWTHRLFEPPNKKFKASKLYKSLIAARVAAKRNQLRREDQDEHAYSCRVKLVRQLAVWDHENCAVLSCDNKNKVNVGVLAVSRYTHIDRIFPTDDAPNYPDHDFPNPDSKIIPMGYMLLHSPSGVELVKDPRDGREQFECPTTGLVSIVNRAAKFHGSTMAEHAKDIIQMRNLFRKKKVLILVTDNGPDWTSRSLMNLLYYFRIWLELELDVLIVVSYCPYHSALNPIEHAWCPCTKAITGVTLEDKLPDEVIRPAAQGLDAETLRRKETTILDTAMMDLCNYFNRAQTDEYVIASTFKQCRDPVEKQLSDNHARLKSDLSSAAKIKANDPLFKELKLMMGHLDRRWDSAIFKRCLKKTCKICAPRRYEPSKTLQFLYSHPDFPNANPSPTHPGHFSTFMDYLHGSVPGSNVPDTQMNRVIVLRRSIPTSRCLRCNYTYSSKADYVKHTKLFHEK